MHSAACLANTHVQLTAAMYFFCWNYLDPGISLLYYYFLDFES